MFEVFPSRDQTAPYLVVAKNGVIGLSIRLSLQVRDAFDLQSRRPAKAMYLGLRVRSAPLPGYAASRGALLDAWPHLQFSEIDQHRAAISVGGWVRLSDDNREAIDKLIADEHFCDKLVAAVFQFFGPEHAVLSQADVSMWLDEQIKLRLDILAGVAKAAPISNEQKYDVLAALDRIVAEHKTP